ncbi:MAG: hypothetical protein FJ087_01540 [Deltaproteobacteria bacterium]|nr:hypothetical protein [Deltaproteobacteria bacterium]
MNEYGTPDIQVTIGGQVMPAIASVSVVADRRTPIARAEIELDRDRDAASDVTEQDPLEVALGFRGQVLRRVFRGRVHGTGPERLVGVTALDRMRELQGVRIRQAWRNANAQDVLAWSMRKAGVESFRLGAVQTSARHLFIAANEGFVDVVRRVRDAWSLDWDLSADPEGVVYCMPWAETPWAQAGIQLELEFGRNMTGFEPRTGGRTGSCETFLAPWLWHSHLVSILDQDLWGRWVTVRVERVEHKVTFKGSAKGGRTRIEWSMS